MRQSIRNIRSNKPTPPRVCDVIVEGDQTYLEFKIGKNDYEIMLLKDLLYQIEIAREQLINN